MVPSSPREPGATAVASGNRPRDPTVAGYFDAFAPAPEWDELVWWPPDVFALCNLVLDHTEAYRFFIAPPSGTSWPPWPGWNRDVTDAARAWRDAVTQGTELPSLVRSCWSTVTRRRDVPLSSVRGGDAWDLCEALMTLHSAADEACAGIALGTESDGGSLEATARASLDAHGSLSRLSPERVRVVPKTHFAPGGITIRSVSRYLALSYEPLDIRWRHAGTAERSSRRTYNIVLVPWPLSVAAHDFRPVPPDLLGNMDSSRFGFFEFAPDCSLDLELVAALLDAAQKQAGAVDAVVFPEGAVRPDEIEGLERTLAEQKATLLVAGVREPGTAATFGRNYLHLGVRSDAGWDRYEQDKHHRWCLDQGQIRQYHLTRSLDPRKLWWEAIDIRERTLHVVDVGGGVTAVPMVCEDLARLDEVADVVRRIGPSLVLAVLLDGPQLPARWPCRYAGVVADDPGSSVLTLTSYGMATRSRPPGRPRSAVVAHWHGADGGVEIELARGASAVLLSTSLEHVTRWTADGRRHEDVPALTLSDVHQLRPRRHG
jgi:hypothetical protein